MFVFVFVQPIYYKLMERDAFHFLPKQCSFMTQSSRNEMTQTHTHEEAADVSLWLPIYHQRK